MKGIRKQNADSTYNLRIPLTICEFNLQLRITQQLNLTIQMFYHFLWIPQTVPDSANTIADSANSPIFRAILSGTKFRYLFVDPKQHRR